MSRQVEIGADAEILTESEEYAFEEIREMLDARPALADKLRRELTDADEPGVSDLRTRILSYIEIRLGDEHFTAEELAREVGLSRSSLERACRESFGITPGALTRLMRMEEAARLLAESGEDVGQIAFAVGYAGVSQFTRAFRQGHGVTPTEWRARSQRPPGT